MKKTSKIKIAETYADALFRAALDANCLKNVARDVSILKDIEDLSALASPFLKAYQQDELLDLLAQKLKLDKISIDFLHVLMDNKILLELKSITEAFDKRLMAHQGIVKVFVQTAEPLTKTQEGTLKKGLEKKLKKDVILDIKLNENLLGGLILRMNSVEIDDSISNKLKTLENMMKGC